MALFSVLCSSKQPLSAGFFLEKVVRYTNNSHHPLHELGSCEMSHCTYSTLMDLDGSGLPTKIGCACRQPVLNDWGSYLRFMGFITTCGFKLLYPQLPTFQPPCSAHARIQPGRTSFPYTYMHDWQGFSFGSTAACQPTIPQHIDYVNRVFHKNAKTS